MKTFFNKKLVESIAGEVSAANPLFNAKPFISQAGNGLTKLELKARSHHIAHALADNLPGNFEEAATALLEAMKKSEHSIKLSQSGGLEGMGGFRYLPFLDFVELYGLEHAKFSLKTLEQMTRFFSAEFAIRPFIIQSPKLALSFVTHWSKHSDWQIRRLASEGTRPRLPWGRQLPEFVRDPSPILTVLDRLYTDNNLIVRRSVANSLNDIAKDHPDLAAATASKWIEHPSAAAQWTAKHGMRTLIKQGHPQALAALGFKLDPKIRISNFSAAPSELAIGGRLDFKFTVTSREKNPVKLVVDFALERVLANGRTARKVFKLKSLELEPNKSVTLNKYMDLIQRSTRTYYPGEHAIDILVNGESKKTHRFIVV
ncbi:MAG: hypothetical protein AB8B79_08195 [Granulosicoccus sp.]